MYTIFLGQAWEEVYGVNISDAANAETYSPEELGKQMTAGTTPGNRIGFIGLGAMGFGMATHLLKSNFCVLGYDVRFSLHSSFITSKEQLIYSSGTTIRSWIVQIVRIVSLSDIRQECRDLYK